MKAQHTQHQSTLDPLNFPLHGRRLIEASAGTGKTFTLALLYIRLVLGHGLHGNAFDRPLTPPEILVVTFTDAATKELHARIRARLVEAADCFATVTGTAAADPMLQQLRADYPLDDWPGCARRLRQAADWMDEAMIATIHGFCQRMLQEHAFATRGLFQRELVTDQSELLDEALRDYWRQHFYPLSAQQSACIRECVASPAALKTKLSDWLAHQEARISHGGTPVQCDDLRAPLDIACQQRQRFEAAAACEDQARAQWKQHRQAVESQLLELRPHLNGTKHRSTTPEKFQALLDELAAWSEGEPAPKTIHNFAQGAFAFKKGAKVQQVRPHVAFEAIATWQAELQQAADSAETSAPPLESQLLAHAAHWLTEELPRRLGQRAEMGFNDLLRDLDAALNPTATAEQTRADTLAATLRRQFPVALIDEFQDTDPLQYRIFDRVYTPTPDVSPDSDSAPRTGLILIGDPKQAIYGFRGADIHAYLAARQRSQGPLYTLETNYRSTEALVEACNHWFLHAEQHPRGAFRFHEIPYLEASARGQAEQLLIQNEPASAMTLWWLENADQTPVGSTAYRHTMAEVAAAEIVRWLHGARAGHTGFRCCQSSAFRPLRPRDIAILVRTGTEAATMRQALAARQVNSVYVSDRESVFNTTEAMDVHQWLQACAEPNNESLVRAALGTNTLDIPLHHFADWQGDELAWEAQLECFRRYRQLWQHQGVLAALHRLMHEQQLPARLLAHPEGERRLTNVLHLAEWLQRAATQMDGEQALIRHLGEHLGQSESNDESIVRLESDAELVQVVTIHKSKGLEYPLVLLPFICSWRAINGKVRSVSYRPDASACSHQGALGRTIEVAGQKAFPEAWKQAEEARLSEDMRLLYVAMTRASHGLWLGIAPLRSGTSNSPQLEHCAVGHVLNGGQRFPTSAAVYQCLEQLSQACDAMALVPAPPADEQVLMAVADTTLAPARVPAHQPFAPWWISSYSALSLGMTASRRMFPGTPSDDPVWPLDAETAKQETALEESRLESSEVTQVGGESPPLHDFPRGSRFGTFLHGLLEWAGRAEPGGFATAAAHSASRRDMLARRCALRGLHQWIDPLNDWLGALLTQSWSLHGLTLPPADAAAPELSAPELRLTDLTPNQVQVEMEFWIQTRGVSIRQLDALIRQHCLPGAERPQLRAGMLNGLLKGFIDLVFEHQGRFYVLDWKSNWLGTEDSAYSATAMRMAILHHRYDLQYLLYLLALHRLLSARLPDYAYDRHIGGAVCVFLRGASATTQGLFTNRPPRALIEGLDQLFAGGSAASTTAAIAATAVTPEVMA
ncbi:exodeoxyribonuclease V subunit beta [Rhabdochromatium marinum]|uniref:exodeoxyribonuclease V subunit beta n=1 Tax=Rhabdochromatium marinum TaxID=48729 RepID=UPI001902E09C|nr:exodeoxyribonuclease V subunit beta [Rhabdochromatium marinum]MBK1648160.1 exodeoxyribonuclease V subunit beta [Rhabdochromatium marinum]